MQFTNPIWLWGLTGLLIPIGIHLLSRKEGKIIKVGSVRHLEDTNTKQFKSLRLNEIALLLLRCLVITVLVLFLAGLNFYGIDKKENWLLIEKGLEHDQQFHSLIDSLNQNGFKVKLLTYKFPDIEDSVAAKEKLNYWKLINDLKMKSVDHIVVLSYNYFNGFNGKRISLPASIQWISKNPDPVGFPLKATRFSSDSVSIRMGQSNADETYFDSKHNYISPGQSYYTETDSISIESSDTVSIAIVSDSAFIYDKKMIFTALNVLKETDLAVFQIESFNTTAYRDDSKAEWTFWLSNKTPPSSIHRKTMYYQPKAQPDLLFLQETSSSWRLTKRLNEEIALRENLTVQLGLILLPKEKYTERMDQFDKRVLSEKIAWDPKELPVKEYKAASTENAGQKSIAILLVIFLLIERLVAFKRKQ